MCAVTSGYCIQRRSLYIFLPTLNTVRLPGNTCSVVENVSPLVILCPFRYSPPLSRSWSNWTGGREARRRERRGGGERGREEEGEQEGRGGGRRRGEQEGRAGGEEEGQSGCNEGGNISFIIEGKGVKRLKTDNYRHY